jgi:hypothetical protein
MNQDRSASNDTQVVSTGLHAGVDGQRRLRDIGSVAHSTFNYIKARSLLNSCSNVLMRCDLQHTVRSIESGSKFSDGRSDVFVNWREHTKFKVVSSDDQHFRNLLAGCTESRPSALSLSLSLSLALALSLSTLCQLSKHEKFLAA